MTRAAAAIALAVIATMIAATPDQPEVGMAMAFTTVMLTGVFQIVFGALKLGRYVTMMPYTVISGFMSGIGFILIIIQLPPLLGFASPSGGVLGSLTALPGFFAEVKANPIDANVEAGVAAFKAGGGVLAGTAGQPLPQSRVMAIGDRTRARPRGRAFTEKRFPERPEATR